MNPLYYLRGRPGATLTTSDQADALPINLLAKSQGDTASGEATRAKHPETKR